jgi:hypothetical protein
MTRRRKRKYRFQSTAPLVLGQRRAVAAPRLSARSILVGTACVAVLVLVLWVSFSPRFYVSRAEVLGAERVPVQSIFAASGLDMYHVLWVDEEQVALQILENEPKLAEAHVDCGLPANCTIVVKEHSLMLNWIAGGQLYWVDTEGQIEPADHLLEGLWMIEGPIPSDENGVLDEEVLVGLKELEYTGVAPQEMMYLPGRGLVVADSAWNVILGQGPGMARRLEVYAAVRDHLLEQGIQPRFVDVRFPDAPYYSEVNEW